MKPGASLDDHVKSAVSMGCTRADGTLGIQRMPGGYALMIDADQMYFFWLRHDGVESSIHWNKWAIRRSAVLDGEQAAGGKE